jgi:hypothetical protein
MMMDTRDIEFAIDIYNHIENPCVCPVTGKTLRYKYLDIARKFLDCGTRSAGARMLLEHQLDKYADEIIYA